MMKPKMLYMLMTCLALAVFLMGCEKPDASKMVILDNPNEYEALFVTTLYSDTDDRQHKTIRDEKKVKAFVEELDGKELVQPTDDEWLEKRDQRAEPGSYQIGLFKPVDYEQEEREAYFVTFYSDGTIEVDQLGNHYFVKNPHPNLFNQLKTDWGITF